MTAAQLKRFGTAVAVALMLLCFSARAAEKITLHVGSQTMHGEVLKIAKLEVHFRPDGAKEQVFPFALLPAADVYECYKLVFEPENAALRFEMGSYFAKVKLLDEAKMELAEAVKLDPSLKDKADEILQKFAIAAAPSKPSDDSKKTDAKVSTGDTKSKPDYSDDTPRKIDDFRKRFLRRDVPPRTEAQMKDFLAKRLDELNKIVGGQWRMIETKHYYCFANIPEPKHNFVANKWNETLYDLLCSILKHKEGDKLWNNKMPIYYFESFRQFQKFAVLIDKSPGAAYSGGYFAADGREVHICIPFMSERFKTNPERMDQMARGTLGHEGTHAFLQLTGEDVHLSNWLHEGMAQFIQFLTDSDTKATEKKDTVNAMREVVMFNKGEAPAWDMMKDRPFGGTDMAGYCCAYSKLEFLYRNFPVNYLPDMIRLIKTGKSENEAMETVFQNKIEKLEEVYRTWIKAALKANFEFPPHR